MVSAHHVIFLHCAIVKCVDGIATGSIAGTIMYTQNLCLWDDVTVWTFKRIGSFHMKRYLLLLLLKEYSVILTTSFYGMNQEI